MYNYKIKKKINLRWRLKFKGLPLMIIKIKNHEFNL